MSERPPTIAVIGAGDAPADVVALAEEVGRVIAVRGAWLVCGGLGGVMAGAARGARAHGGRTIGVLPGTDRRAANEWIEVAIATGFGEARNVVVVSSADAVVALAGEGGTLSEIGFARKLGRPVVALRAWKEIDGIEHVEDAEEAVSLALSRRSSASQRQSSIR